jgi:glycerol kinase
MNCYLLVIDQGTSSCRTLAFNKKGQVLAKSQIEIEIETPQSSWVEQNAQALYDTQIKTIKNCVEQCSGISNCAGVSITNQRETIVAWHKITGAPLGPAIVWQDKRTLEFCNELTKSENEIKNLSGLPNDPYFSASKMKWFLENNTEVQKAYKNDELCIGTIDSWLIYRLSKGKRFVTDPTNASRTQLYNIEKGNWDSKLLDLFGIDPIVLAEVIDNDQVMATCEIESLKGLPILTSMGDQQAALFGHNALDVGEGKCTFGTGCFALSYQGHSFLPPKSKLMHTVAFKIDQEIHYAYEGNVMVAGAAIQFLRDNLGIIDSASQSEEVANQVSDSGGVVFVPALAGLGAPHWEPSVRGSLWGLSRGTNKSHIVRAALEGVAFSARELIEVLEMPGAVQIDGGMVENKLFCQILSDLLQAEVKVASSAELTARGVFGMSGIILGWWSLKEWQSNRIQYETYTPKLSTEVRGKMLDSWNQAIKQSMDW